MKKKKKKKLKDIFDLIYGHSYWYVTIKITLDFVIYAQP